MAEIDFSLLDVPRTVPVVDPEAYLRAAIAWHFGQDTGSPFWLRMAPNLEFDPLTDVNGFDDLRLFPNLVNELRDTPVQDLIPRGYGSPAPVPKIFESGGTTGAPKRTAQLPDWVEQVTRWQLEDFTAGGFVGGQGLLFLMPTGPHGVGHFSRAVSERLGSVFFPVDLDPRWVKKIATRGAGAEVSAYVEHVLEQARFVLHTQNVANLHTSPPLLGAIARDNTMADLVNQKIRYILLSGAHVDLDTLDLLREIFPRTAIAMAFGSTMILSQAKTRLDGDIHVFDPRTPYVVFWVIDPETGERVSHGQRGQVVMNHISKGMFIPNNLERDTAIRRPGPGGQVGDSVSEVAPVATFEGEAVIEGVY
ncbi:putative phenazine antibiotic biosynthesis protein [Mycobacteroides abscessus subsp. massiliense]|uniref:phenazine antibiotic biosynthesis protein n=1 Tax=Mycobacteroides abscessus TaxID=36809 RepID=UPI0009A5E906|nr:phenazine antibiotic biosynthesis protein [Mycobacteroides abscessus]SKR21690.1 putative phenazine antibiotic biosynthesis protein [Mycobacteroides abscessus subsp. massiliense]SKR36976.1 putative phenazine antibiotic biosynthesis protein [Mycobacteroides abscessus subsp. massiliense]SKT45765.1 putative phenazine antibiotic biosynthesis protein [Mycobacteroides abscessus subsp. massiliense]SKT67680.1 putative phenazine antibiotic biosynthesis protein [Mycobacteroides abscessus subsp. massili